MTEPIYEVRKLTILHSAAP